MSEETKRTLVKKLAEIMGEVSRVAKTGRNASQGYDYATEADVAAAVRGGMAARSVVLIPSVEKTEWGELPTRSGGVLRLCTLTVRFRLEDGDSGETRDYVIIGQGTDSGDKASYKAMTGAEKYALMKLFLIPTGDDPEQDDAPPPPPRRPQFKKPPAQASEHEPKKADAPLAPPKGASAPFKEDELKAFKDTELAGRLDVATAYVARADLSDEKRAAAMAKLRQLKAEVTRRTGIDLS